LCYRTICAEGPEAMGRHAHPEVSMHAHPLATYMSFIDKDDWRGVGELMLDSAARLKKIGADFLICPDNTIHQALDPVIERSPLPWLHIADEVAAEAERRGYRRPDRHEVSDGGPGVSSKVHRARHWTAAPKARAARGNQSNHLR
jgi:aspartate racemase